MLQSIGLCRTHDAELRAVQGNVQGKERMSKTAELTIYIDFHYRWTYRRWDRN